MKPVQKLAVAILTLILAVPAFAGQIQSPGVASTDTSSTVTDLTTAILVATVYVANKAAIKGS